MSRRTFRRLLAVPALALAGAAALATPVSAAAEAASAEIEFECDFGYFWATVTITNDSDSSYAFSVVLDAGSTIGSILAHSTAVPAIGTNLDANPTPSYSVTVDGVVLLSGTVENASCDPDPDASATIEVMCPAEGSDQDIAVIYTFTTAGYDTFDYVTPDGTEASETVTMDTVTTGNKVSEGDEIDVWVKVGDNELASLTTTVDCTDDSGAGIPDAGATDTIPLVAAGVLLAGLLLTGGGALARRRHPLG